MESDNGNKILYQKATVNNTYKRKTSMVGDFFYGFFLAALVFFVAAYVAAIYDKLIYFYGSILLLIVICVYFFKKGRRFVMIGAISLGLIPLLIFGSCLYNLNNNFLPSPGQPRIF